MTRDNKKIIKAQELAKKIGHCLCDIRQTCPCDLYKEEDICKCSK